MPIVRLTQNAVASYQRGLRPADSLSSAHRALSGACAEGRYIDSPPSWLTRVSADNDGYLLLDGDLAVLPIRRGRVVACLINPHATSLCAQS